MLDERQIIDSCTHSILLGNKCWRCDVLENRDEINMFGEETILEMAIIVKRLADHHNCNDESLREMGIDWITLHSVNREIELYLNDDLSKKREREIK
jgi:hypothetical protein